MFSEPDESWFCLAKVSLRELFGDSCTLERTLVVVEVMEEFF